MSATIRQIAEWIGGEVLGNADLAIESARPLSDAGPADLTFLEDEKALPRLHDCPARAAIVPLSVPANGKTLIRAADPLMAFVRVVQRLHGRAESPPAGIDAFARVHPSAQIGPDAHIEASAVISAGVRIGARCRIAPGVVVGRDCRIGDDVRLYPNAVLYDGCVLGHRVIIHAGAVIGADGFGYRFHEGQHVKVPQLGWVELGDDVEIGANTTIDRGTFGPTCIGTGTKIDNLVQIGHNCRIGQHNLFVSQVGLAGSTTTGNYVVLAGQVGVVGHLHIGDGTKVGGQSAVTKDVPPGSRVLGAPARPDKEQMRILMSIERLPEMRRQLRDVRRYLGLEDDQ